MRFKAQFEDLPSFSVLELRVQRHLVAISTMRTAPTAARWSPKFPPPALAFADHAAEFYAGSGNDRGRALELARANVANRPTRRAIKQAQAMAMSIPIPGERP